MKRTNKKGVALLLVVLLVVISSLYYALFLWEKIHSQRRPQRLDKINQAIFLARAAIEHFILKVKTLQKQAPNTIMTIFLDLHTNSHLLKVFIEDILVLPDDDYTAATCHYSLVDFSVESLKLEQNKVTMLVNSVGTFSGERVALTRLLSFAISSP